WCQQLSLMRYGDILGPLIQTACRFRLIKQAAGFRARPFGSVAKDLMNIIEITLELRTSFTHRLEIIPVVHKESLLQIAIPEAARAEAVLEITCDLIWSDALHQLYCEIFVGIRLRFLGASAVHNDTHDLLSKHFFVTKDLNRIAVALTHLLAVGPRHDGDLPQNLSFRNHESLAVKVIEFDCDVSRHLDVLLLIAAHRNNVRAKRQDVRSHQDGIGKYPVVNLFEIITCQPCLFVLVAVTTFQQTHRGDSRQ